MNEYAGAAPRPAPELGCSMPMKWNSVNGGSTSKAFNGLPGIRSPVAFERCVPAPANASMYKWLRMAGCFEMIVEYADAYFRMISSLTSDQ